MRLRWVFAVIVLLLLGVAGYRLWLPPQVAVETVKPRPLEQRLVATGRVISPERVTVGSIIVGTVAEVLVDEGDQVSPAQPLIRLDDRELQAAVQRTESALRQARANLSQIEQVQRQAAAEARTQAELQLRQARRDHRRAVELAQENFVSRAEVEARKETLDLAASRLRSAEQALAALQPGGSEHQAALAAVAQAVAAHAEARARLGYALIRAPTAGTILRRSVDPGDVAQPGAALLVLASAGETRIEVQLDERNLGLVEVGQPALASADAFPQERFDAVVRFIAPAVDPQRGTVKLELAVPAPPEYLRADMTVTLDILAARREQALTVPRSAVRDGDSRPWVLVVRDGRAVRQDVSLGLRSDGRVELRSGVAAGTTVLVDARSAQPRQRVRAREVAR